MGLMFAYIAILICVDGLSARYLIDDEVIAMPEERKWFVSVAISGVVLTGCVVGWWWMRPSPSHDTSANPVDSKGRITANLQVQRPRMHWSYYIQRANQEVEDADRDARELTPEEYRVVEAMCGPKQLSPKPSDEELQKAVEDLCATYDLKKSKERQDKERQDKERQDKERQDKERQDKELRESRKMAIYIIVENFFKNVLPTIKLQTWLRRRKERSVLKTSEKESLVRILCYMRLKGRLIKFNKSHFKKSKKSVFEAQAKRVGAKPRRSGSANNN
jgi:hypothetical protein